MTKATGPLFDVHFRRRREARTNYAKRLALLKSGSPRLVVRKLNRAIVCQLIVFDVKGDRTLCQATSLDLKEFGFNAKRNVPSAFLTGFLLGRKAVAMAITKAVPDFGLHTASKGGILFAVVKGAIDAGLQLSVVEDKLPSKERLAGKHLGIDALPIIEKIKAKNLEANTAASKNV